VKNTFKKKEKIGILKKRKETIFKKMIKIKLKINFLIFL